MAGLSQFPNHTQEALSAALHFAGVSILAFCFARRAQHLTSWAWWMSLTWGRTCVMLVMLDSWAFVFYTGLLVHGVGLDTEMACKMAIYACISFYALSKLFIYAFLVERVYIVWTGGNTTSRTQSKAYRASALIFIGYAAIITTMFIGKQSELRRDDGVCIVGLPPSATIALASYDMFVTGFLSAMFVWPLRRSQAMSHRLRGIATRTLLAGCAALTTSAANVVILSVFHGRELGYVCLSSCVADVLFNALSLFWITSAPPRADAIELDRFSLPTMDLRALRESVDLETALSGSSSLTTTREKERPSAQEQVVSTIVIPREEGAVVAS